MTDESRIEHLLDELAHAHATPEEVCANCPELLGVVRVRWQQLRRVGAELDALFPPPEKTAPYSPEEPALPLVPGYAVEAVLGRGGMGIVFRARHLRLKRLVALKMLLGGTYAGPHERARFQREAEAVASLRHENIVRVYDVGEHEGRPYFTMELVEGGSLAQKLAGTPQPARQAAALVATVAGAVRAAHQGGVIHRDLKPGNVLLTADGTAKVSDFGLARRLEGGTALTQSGVVMGTPSYMAPEQARGQAQSIGPAVDVYALGAILYELLTGRPPFRAETTVATVYQVITQDPVPPSRLNFQVPRDLETICLKCLHKEPGRRYASALALADDLRRFQAGEPIRARPVGAAERGVKWVRRHAAVAALTALVLLVTVLGMTGVFWKYLDAEQQKRAALQEADKATKARDFLVSIFELSDARTQTAALTPRLILDDAERRIPKEFADQPELQLELQTAIDRVYAKITGNAPLAMILEARGRVQLASTHDAPQRPVPQTLLYAGNRLSLGDDGQVRLVVLSDLHQEWLRPGQEATVGRKGCEPADAVTERTDDVLMTFVRLPKGTFYMGWDGQKKGVKTAIPEDFEIAVHDVTQGQWQAVMGENPSWFSRFGGGRNEVKTLSDEELKLFPVESVSWDDAQEFIRRWNEKERGRGYWYRLPTEAEWEYACRGGAASEEECSHHFYFDKPTNDLSSEQANFDGNEPFGKAPKGKHLERTSRVGAYPSNKLGLCDVHGNVWQWCADNYDVKEGTVLAAHLVGQLGGPFGPGPFLAASGLSRPGQVPLGGWLRVIRGGGWTRGGYECRAANRLGYAPSLRRSFLGFRIARVRAR
jgi:formylglycine-generating enzyme required for sulfatase activity